MTTRNPTSLDTISLKMTIDHCWPCCLVLRLSDCSDALWESINDPDVLHLWCLWCLWAYQTEQTLDCFKDIVRCLLFSDDWEDDVNDKWDTKHSDAKVEPKENTATHWKKFSMRLTKMLTIDNGRVWCTLGSGWQQMRAKLQVGTIHVSCKVQRVKAN